jgi:hypothetical protein
VTFVFFDPSTVPRAKDWFDNPIQTMAITKNGDFSQSADGSCPVKLADGSIAYAKPRQANKLVIAREKIASDLARLVLLPVAPVVIRKGEPGVPPWDHDTALSLACLASARLWAAGGVTHVDKAAPALEAMRVFWTWLGDSDHNGHGQNVLYEIQGDRCAIVAIDHSHSLCHGNQNDPLAVVASAGYATAGRADCHAALTDTAGRIHALDWPTIEGLVQRLDGLLTTEEQNRIKRILEERRKHLNQILSI